MTAIQVGFYPGDSDGVNQEGNKMDGVVPVIIKSCRIFDAAVKIGEPPGNHRSKGDRDGLPRPQIPGGDPDRQRIEREETQLVSGDVIEPSHRPEEREASRQNEKSTAGGRRPGGGGRRWACCQRMIHSQRRSHQKPTLDTKAGLGNAEGPGDYGGLRAATPCDFLGSEMKENGVFDSPG